MNKETKQEFFRDYDNFVNQIKRLEEENKSMKERLYMFDSMMSLFNKAMGCYGVSNTESLSQKALIIGEHMLSHITVEETKVEVTNVEGGTNEC